MTGSAFDALLVLSFGGPDGPDEVMPFLENVTRGRGVPARRLGEVARHYEMFGGVSPINAANQALVSAVRARLDLPVYWGNRNWHPLVAATLERMAADGVQRALCFVTSAYGGQSSCRQYLDDVESARRALGAVAPEVHKLRHFYDHPLFVAAFAGAAAEALGRCGPDSELVFSAHSVPVDQAADYEPQVREAARLVACALGAPRWSTAWQSRSGRPGDRWLEPDVPDVLAGLADAGTTSAVVVPIGFVADNMEVVYDLDVEARERAREVGLDLTRAATPGTELAPLVAELVAERVAGARPRRLADLPPSRCCGM